MTKNGISTTTGGTAEPLAHSQPLPRQGSTAIHLPPDLAALTVHHFFAKTLRYPALLIFDQPGQMMPDGRRLSANTWALMVSSSLDTLLMSAFRDAEGRKAVPIVSGPLCWLVFPLHTLWIHAGWELEVRAALESVKPQPLDARGLPAPWVPAEPPTQRLDSERLSTEREQDVSWEAEGPPLPPSSAAPASLETGLDPASDDSIQQALWALCARVGLGAIPLQVVRLAEVREGFVGGHIVLSAQGPRRIRLDLDPNADAAEVWATLLHEIAHALTPQQGHNAVFQRAMVDLAGAIFGTPFLATASAQVGSAMLVVDAWVAVCVRAALRNGTPPTPEAGDEGHLARVVGRIQKLRRLAHRHPGTPEAIAASAKANDLLVRWDLGSYRVRLEAGIDEQMCDRWVDVGKGAVWRRRLGFVVADFCGVFSLSREDRGWMHFFGRYADVITAEWFFEIWREHIERSCEAHLEHFRTLRAQGLAQRNPRSERTNFCDSAVLGIQRKLKAASSTAAEEGGSSSGEDLPDAEKRKEAAEHFAGAEFRRRGQSWTSSSGKTITLNAEGLAAGAAAPMGRGVGGPTAKTKGLIE